MNVFDHARLIIYRMHEKGLEIFLVHPGLVEEGEFWSLPDAQIDKEKWEKLLSQSIELDPVQDAEGRMLKAVAVEGDWHDMPSLRNLVQHDVNFVKTKIKSAIPELDQGAFFAIKEAFKKVLPQEYQFLKELKDVLLEQNLVKSI